MNLNIEIIIIKQSSTHYDSSSTTSNEEVEVDPRRRWNRIKFHYFANKPSRAGIEWI